MRTRVLSLEVMWKSRAWVLYSCWGRGRDRKLHGLLTSQPSLLGWFQASEWPWCGKQSGWYPEEQCLRLISDLHLCAYPGILTQKHAHTCTHRESFRESLLSCLVSPSHYSRGRTRWILQPPLCGWVQRFLWSCFDWHVWSHSTSVIKPKH